MSYHSLLGLGADIPTSPPTKQAEVWAPTGFKYLQVDEAGNPRPEYPAILAAGSMPGIGWTKDKVDLGQTYFNERVMFAPYTFSGLLDEWSKQGFAVVYVAQYLGAPDALIRRIMVSELMKWAGQPGVWIARMPYNGPYTKAGWSTYLPGGSVNPSQPVPPPPPPAECPPGTVLVNGVCKSLGTPGSGGGTSQVNPLPGQPVPEAPWSFSEWYDGLSRDRKNFLVGSAIGLSVATAWWVYKTYYAKPSRRRRYGGSSYPGGPVPIYDAEFADEPRPRLGQGRVYDAEPMADIPGLPEAPRSAEYEVPRRPLLGMGTPQLTSNGRKRVPVYISATKSKADKVAEAMRKMGGDLRHQGGARSAGGRRAFSYVYLFPESKVKRAVAAARKVGGRSTVAKADKRIKVLGRDHVEFPRGFRRNPASIPMFWVRTGGGKHDRKFTAV